MEGCESLNRRTVLVGSTNDPYVWSTIRCPVLAPTPKRYCRMFAGGSTVGAWPGGLLEITYLDDGLGGEPGSLSAWVSTDPSSARLPTPSLAYACCTWFSTVRLESTRH